MGSYFSNLRDEPVLHPPTFTVGNFSPNHFFYDCLPGLFHATENLDPSIARALREPDRTYMDLRSVLSSDWDIRSASSDENGQGDLGIRLGLHYSLLERTTLSRMESQISHAAGRTELPFDKVEKFVLWIDLAQTNRSWNQEEVLPGLLSKLSERVPALHVIFDGITSTRYENVEVVALDSWLVEALERENIPYTNLQGANSTTKIAFAFQTDFYLASFTTGSMYLSRFAGRPGIALSPPRTFAEPKLQ
jgi:hypothetical protein